MIKSQIISHFKGATSSYNTSNSPYKMIPNDMASFIYIGDKGYNYNKRAKVTSII